MLEYDAFVSSAPAETQLRFSRAALLKGYECLVQVGIIQLRGGRGRAQLTHAPAKLAVTAEELRAFVHGKEDCPTSVQRWATSFVDAVVN